jgi:hypothetical protein
MRTIAPGTGSIADQLNAVAIVIRACADLPELEYRWPRIVRSLKASTDRAGRVRRHGGAPVGIDGPIAWLEATVKDHPALREPGAEPLQSELLGLIRRVRPGKTRA